MNPYNESVNELCVRLITDKVRGLSRKEVAARHRKYGFNELPEAAHESWITVFIRQFQSPLIYVLLIAAAIIYFVGPDKYDAFIISGVLLFNALVGTIQEGRTRAVLDALRRFIKTNTLVVRDGEHILVEDRELVPGDLVLIREGQRIGADARIVVSNNIRLDESSLTGESTGVRKQEVTLSGNVLVFEQTNMVFQGTYVMAGSGSAIVVATGAATELGKIHGSLVETNVNIPLRQELDRLSHHILLGILGLCVILLAVGLLTGKPFRELLVMLTALFICVVPEGLPVVLTLVLVTGTYRMAKNNVLIKNLQAVEGLGRTDVIIIDKTGTLTRNEMMVSRVYADNKLWEVTGRGYFLEGAIAHDTIKLEQFDPTSGIWHMGVAVSLLNSAEIVSIPAHELFEIKGEPTEAALYIFSKKLGIKRSELEKTYSKIYEIPFDSTYRYHAGFYRSDGQVMAFVTGSPELIISRSANVPADVETMLKKLLDDGLRIVAVAMKTISSEALPSTTLAADDQVAAWKRLVESDLQILGLCGIEDAIRSGIVEIVAQARDAGLQVVMATGDHRATALYVAKKTGIFRAGDVVFEGTDLARMTDKELAASVAKVSVCARVTPEQKIRLVRAFQYNKLLVAMTGDGINDGPSLVAADLGIGMGRIGTEVAKQASDIILLDDSFESIIKAITLGRHIFYTLRRVILYFFATNMGEVLIVLFALVAGLPLPITAAQILWLNLVTDGFLDIALSMEPQEGSLLGARWRYRGKHLVDAALWGKTLFMALPMGLGSLAVFMYYYQQDLVLARTMTLFTMAMFQWFNAWSCRSTTKSVFQLGFFSNPWLLAATSLVFVLQLALLYVPFMQSIFKTVPLNSTQFLLVLVISSSVLVLEEMRKAFSRWRESFRAAS